MLNVEFVWISLDELALESFECYKIDRLRKCVTLLLEYVGRLHSFQDLHKDRDFLFSLDQNNTMRSPFT